MSFIAYSSWLPTTKFALGQEIVDSNGNVQKVTTAGTTGSTEPCPSGKVSCTANIWGSTAGNTNTDGTVVWSYQGVPSAIAITAEAGGVSGIVIDNVSSSTGASQIYFSTLANTTCATSGGTGGCAIQASQSAP
jgi:hypothetical protein